MVTVEWLPAYGTAVKLACQLMMTSQLCSTFARGASNENPNQCLICSFRGNMPSLLHVHVG